VKYVYDAQSVLFLVLGVILLVIVVKMFLWPKRGKGDD
jgi:hypothetical protein